MDPKRPSASGLFTTTPKSADLIAVLGSRLTADGLALTTNEYRALAKIYSYRPERPSQRPPMPEEPTNPTYQEDEDYKRRLEAWKNWTDPVSFMQAGADRNLVRHAQLDGFRLIAWLAKYISEGEDPLKTVIRLALDAGWDISPEDVEWATEVEE